MLGSHLSPTTNTVQHTHCCKEEKTQCCKYNDLPYYLQLGRVTAFSPHSSQEIPQITKGKISSST